MSYPSLTTSWTPASSCVASTGFWYVVYASGAVFSDMFGMPSVTNLGQKSSPTGGCVPPSYTLSVPYLTDGGCPKNYFGACSTATSYRGRSADYIMCCPLVSGWNFNCAPATDPEPVPYGCQASFPSGAIITGSRTDLVVRTGQAETHTVGGDHGVNAWGIALLSTPPLTSSSAIASTIASAILPTATYSSTTSMTSGPLPVSTSISDSSVQGLGTGAAAGIGVGVGVGVFAILGLLAFWLLRRKRKGKQQQLPVQMYQNHDGAAQNKQSYYAPPSSQPRSPEVEIKTQQNNRPVELDNAHTYEMAG
ncbi:hypothetical protein F4860DRAFT_187050 [Xylaria cubensis]|nr:hypothetical protein F4860DRAFT_187050 [Xylaria cubensis]